MAINNSKIITTYGLKIKEKKKKTRETCKGKLEKKENK